MLQILEPILTFLAHLSHKGHMFCKSCIYTNLLEQKKANKRMRKRWEEANKSGANAEQRKREKENQEKLKEFEKQSETLVGAVSTTSTDVTTNTTSWWLPTHAPEAAKSEIAKPNQDTHCPRTGHILRVKELIAVEFKHEKPAKRATDSEDIEKGAVGTDFICHVCSKDLKSMSKVIMIKSCGHAICYKCSGEFAKKTCPVCEKACDEEGEKIQLQPPASSFAEGGATIAKRESPSAIVM